jgi:hypothetical protein
VLLEVVGYVLSPRMRAEAILYGSKQAIAFTAVASSAMALGREGSAHLSTQGRTVRE